MSQDLFSQPFVFPPTCSDDSAFSLKRQPTELGLESQAFQKEFVKRKPTYPLDKCSKIISEEICSVMKLSCNEKFRNICFTQAQTSDPDTIQLYLQEKIEELAKKPARSRFSQVEQDSQVLSSTPLSQINDLPANPSSYKDFILQYTITEIAYKHDPICDVDNESNSPTSNGLKQESERDFNIVDLVCLSDSQDSDDCIVLN